MTPIYTARPNIPSLEELSPYLREIRINKTVTNNGPLVQRLEHNLGKLTMNRNPLLVTNGTLALTLALLSHNIEPGKYVLTSPLTFIGTVQAIQLAGLIPYFGDIKIDTLTLHPYSLIKAHKDLGDKLGAIMPVHAYGNACDIKGINQARKETNPNLPIIWDAAPAFGTTYLGLPLSSFLDTVCYSLHGTKVFNCGEGGLIFPNKADTYEYIRSARNFGIQDEDNQTGLGFNAKLSEYHAAVGLANMSKIDIDQAIRKTIASRYYDELKDSANTSMHFLKVEQESEWNYAYFPIIITGSAYLTRDELYNRLRAKGIFVRKYYTPLVSNIGPYSTLESAKIESLPFANLIAERVICLPVHAGLTYDEQTYVIEAIKESLLL